MLHISIFIFIFDMIPELLCFKILHFQRVLKICHQRAFVQICLLLYDKNDKTMGQRRGRNTYPCAPFPANIQPQSCIATTPQVYVRQLGSFLEVEYNLPQ